MKKILSLPNFRELTGSDILRIALVKEMHKSMKLSEYDIVGKLVKCGEMNYRNESNVELNFMVYGVSILKEYK